MKTILITGGCGFIGSHLVRHLLEQDADARIVNLDKLTYAGNPENVRDVAERFPDRYRFAQGDIADAAFVERLFSDEKPAFAANLAAESHVDRSIHDPDAFIRTNIHGVRVLLDAARRFGVERFLQVSTDEVYGVAEGERVFREEDRLEPRSPYAASKAGGEMLARSYFVTYGVPVVITRGSNAYGTHQHPEKFIPRSVTNLLLGQSVQVYGHGKHRREWTHVLDHVLALDCAMRNGVPGEVYNFGSGEERENIEIAHLIRELLGKDEAHVEHVKDRPGHDARYRVHADKIRALGWEPTQNFRDGLAKTVAWYRDNHHWWKPLRDDAGYRSYERKVYAA